MKHFALKWDFPRDSSGNLQRHHNHREAANTPREVRHSQLKFSPRKCLPESQY